MSNLSFARIMYGTAQEFTPTALMPPSNLPSQLTGNSTSRSATATTAPAQESLLHKAWRVLTGTV